MKCEDERFPISYCCANPVCVVDYENGIGAVCSHCGDPTIMLFTRHPHTYIAGDTIPMHKLSKILSERFAGIHKLTVVASLMTACSQLIVEDERKKTYYIDIESDGTLSEGAPF